MRTGESLRAMSDVDIFRILSEQEPDFSAKICEGLTIEDLDKEAIAEMKNPICAKAGKSVVSKLSRRTSAV